MTRQAGVRPHVWSSNPDIEAAIRARASEGFLFVINHEAPTPETTVRLADLGFPIGRIVDLADDAPVPLAERDGVVELSLSRAVGRDPAVARAAASSGRPRAACRFGSLTRARKFRNRRYFLWYWMAI